MRRVRFLDGSDTMPPCGGLDKYLWQGSIGYEGMTSVELGTNFGGNVQESTGGSDITK